MSAGEQAAIVSRRRGALSGWGMAALLSASLPVLLASSGCERQRQPVIPRAAFTERTSHRAAVEGRDSTLARLTWPEFVGARTPEALDSLRTTVNALLVEPADGRGAAASSPIALMDGFISQWSTQRQATRSRAYWRLDRRIEVLAETLGVVSLAVSEVLDQGGAHSMSTVRFLNLGADRGNTLRFADLFREDLLDSLGAAIEPVFRESRGIAADSSLHNMGFTFGDGRFRVNENVAITAEGVRWHFDPYEIAPYAWGATDFTAPFELLRPFAKDGGPLAGRGK